MTDTRQTTTTEDYVAAVLENAPPLSDTQHDQLRRLLKPAPTNPNPAAAPPRPTAGSGSPTTSQ